MQNLSVVESLGNTDIPHCEPPKDPAAGAGEVSLHENGCNWNERTRNEEIVNLEAAQQSLPAMNSEGRSCEEFSESSFSPSEPSGSWGDFEGFTEPLDKSETFGDNLEALVNSATTRGADLERSSGGCSISAAHVRAEPSLCHGMQAASGSLSEVRVRQGPEMFVFPTPPGLCLSSVERVICTCREIVLLLRSYLEWNKSNFFAVFDKYLSCAAVEL